MESLQVQQRVQEVYMKLAESGRLTPIDGNRPADEVSKNILEVTLDFLKR